MNRRWLKSVSIAVAICCFASLIALRVGVAADTASVAAKPDHLARILMVTQSKGFQHSSVKRPEPKKDQSKAPDLSTAERTVTELGLSSGLFKVDCTQDAAKDFTKERLANYDIVLFYTTGDLPISQDAKDYFFNDWLKQKGHGFIGTHSATDTYHNYKPYWDMIGGTFDGHPWGNGSEVTVTVHDTKFPAMKPWGDEFTIKDEIYKFKNWQPEKVRVLMSMNMAKTKHHEAYHVPIAWCKDYGQGKAFYISLGHDESVWANPKYQESLLGAIKWILNMEPGDATPNPRLSRAQEAKAKADDAAARTAGK
jgi:type 1 glutamine amidotransferase